MDFFEATEKRFSYKGKFLPDAVPMEHLELIAKAGLLAPSAMNTQCVRLIILPSNEAITPISSITMSQGLITAPAAIVVLTDGYTQKGRIDFSFEDYAAATQSMLVAATALGYVSLWLDSPFFDGNNQKASLAALGIPETHHIRVVLPIGKPADEIKRREKMPFEKRVSYGKFGQGRVT